MGILLISFLFSMGYKILSYTRHQHNRGSVDLQELQGARRAINYLRRDFRSAVAQIPPSLTIGQKKKALRRPVVEKKVFTGENEIIPIVVDDSEIHFFRQLYETSESIPRPATEEVNYHIDGTKQCLVRSAPGSEIAFSDTKGIKFELYAHPLNPEIPMLLVTLKIDDDSQDQIGSHTFFEITTTLSSAVTNQRMNHPYWHSHLE